MELNKVTVSSYEGNNLIEYFIKNDQGLEVKILNYGCIIAEININNSYNVKRLVVYFIRSKYSFGVK